jgi:cytochrome c553
MALTMGEKTMKIYVVFFAFFLLLAGCDRGEQQTVSTAPPGPIAETAQAKSMLDTCAACHGADGVSHRNNAPFIAGQHEAYLLAAMESYLNGNRHYDPMKNALASVTLDDLKSLAQHYAGLSSPWQPPAERLEHPAPAISKRAIAAGKADGTSCFGCHGEDGNSRLPGLPSLAGLQPAYLRSALNAYLDGRRSDNIMVNFRHSLHDRQVNHLVAYFASRTRHKTDLPAKGSVQRGKRASRACVGCHGPNGNSLNLTIPSISGQNADYLVKAINGYRDGTRKSALMRDAVRKLSDRTVADLAAYYAAQTPAEEMRAAKAGKGGFDPVGDGAQMAMACNGCHGDKGNSASAGIPSLTRQSVAYLTAAIRAYRDGGRKQDLMKTFVAGLSDVDAEKIAFYYATQEPATAKPTGQGDAKAGEAVSESCGGCHGDKGNSSDVHIPSLAGQDAEYLQHAITAYAKKTRTNKDMQGAVAELSGQQIRDVVAYYAAQTPVKPTVRLPEAPEVIAQRCNRCHGENGFSTDPHKPRLAGQVASYLAKAIQQYQDGKRESSTMHAMSEVLSLVEIKAVAAYYSQQKKQP